MVTIREAAARLVSFFRQDQRDQEFDQELAAHIEMATADHIRGGVPPEEARRRALAKLGGIEPAKQLHRETRGIPALDGVLNDVRYSVRTLRRSPAFALAAVATLAIGIGATTAIFSTVNATLLRPLPYPNAEQLVDVHTRFVDGRVTTGMVANAEIVALRRLPMVASAGGVLSFVVDVTLTSNDGTQTALTMRQVTEGFFETLGLPMQHGRAFTKEEFRPNRSLWSTAVVLSHNAWQRHFGGDPAIVGTSIRLNEFPDGLMVVGIAAPQMDFPHGTDFWANARPGDLDNSHNYLTLVRLRPDATIEQLLSAGNLALNELGKTVANAAGREFVLQDFLLSLTGDLRPVLLIVLGATLLLLVLACVNVTNLLLAKGATQAHEIAMRTALGAGRGRVIRQLVAQSLVLSAAGTMTGLAVAYGAVRVLMTLGVSDLPRLDTVPFDWRVLLFALTVLVVSGIGMGVLPALRLSDSDLKTVLNEHGRRNSSSAATSRVMSGMIVAEVALAIALVAGAGWLIQSFARLRATDPGFASGGRLVIDVRPTRRFRAPEEVHAWSHEMHARVRSAAAGAVVGAAATFPLGADRDGTTDLVFPGEAPDPNRVQTSRSRMVTPGFFEALDVTLASGRAFTEDDRRTTQRVVIVNRAFARRYFDGADPLGRTIAFGFPKPDVANPAVVVGVVDDIRYKALSQDAEATMFVPQAQGLFALTRQSVVVWREGGHADLLIPQIRHALKQFDPTLVATYTTSDEIVSATLGRQELGMTLMLVFGATALVLAAVGLCGVIAYAAAQRRSELATRIALGATGRQVFWMMMSSGQRLMAAGVILGLTLAYAAGRVVSGSVFAMRAADPVVLLTAGAVVAAVAWLATMIPAIRASRQDPVTALRD
ncbi:MAG TPA: ADOP family duplicated permease [Vicinamibacterales bacterium]|nr:ADOP family duplicated permease [Vicinamibacterales bacterium]